MSLNAIYCDLCIFQSEDEADYTLLGWSPLLIVH